MLKRLERRKTQIDKYYEKLIRQVESGKLRGEEDRIWLDQYAKGEGLDLACGDFLVGEAVGVDIDPKKIGSDLFFIDAKYLSGFENLDFIVCNYLDVFPNPLDILITWNRVLKPSGKLALVVRNSELYENNTGPLENDKRKTLFTPKIISFYLNRAGFEVEKIELWEKSIRCLAVK